MIDTLYPNTPEQIRLALFSCINKNFKTKADKELNDFLLDILNECEKTFSNYELEKLKAAN
jgi:hypothetical protein